MYMYMHTYMYIHIILCIVNQYVVYLARYYNHIQCNYVIMCVDGFNEHGVCEKLSDI